MQLSSSGPGLVIGQVKVCPLFYENIPVSNPKSKGTGAAIIIRPPPPTENFAEVFTLHS